MNIDLCKITRSNYIVYALITNKYATLKELRDDYTIEEVLDLYEMMLINLTNKSLILEEQKRRIKK